MTLKLIGKRLEKEFKLYVHHEGRDNYGIPYVEDALVIEDSIGAGLAAWDTYSSTYELEQGSYHYMTVDDKLVNRSQLQELFDFGKYNEG